MFTRSPCTGLLRFLKSGRPATAQKDRAWRFTPPVLIRCNPASDPKGDSDNFTTPHSILEETPKSKKKRKKFSAPRTLYLTSRYYYAGGQLGAFGLWVLEFGTRPR